MTDLLLQSLFSTSDLALAAAISLFFPIDSIDVSNSSRAEFRFIRNDQIDGLIEAFWRDEMKVSPKAFFYQLKSIKTRIYENR